MTLVVDAPLTPAKVALFGLIVKFVTAIVRVGLQQVKSEEVETTLQPAPEPRLSVTVMVPVLPVALPADSETVVAERVAVAVLERDKLPALTVA